MPGVSEHSHIQPTHLSHAGIAVASAEQLHSPWLWVYVDVQRMRAAAVHETVALDDLRCWGLGVVIFFGYR